MLSLFTGCPGLHTPSGVHRKSVSGHACLATGLTVGIVPPVDRTNFSIRTILRERGRETSSLKHEVEWKLTCLTSHASEKIFGRDWGLSKLFPDQFLPDLDYFSLWEDVLGRSNVHGLVESSRVVYASDGVCCYIIFINIYCCTSSNIRSYGTVWLISLSRPWPMDGRLLHARKPISPSTCDWTSIVESPIIS